MVNVTTLSETNILVRGGGVQIPQSVAMPTHVRVPLNLSSEESGDVDKAPF